MGSFYTTVTTYGSTQEAIAEQLRPIKAYVSPTIDKYTIVYPEMDFADSPEQASERWKALSSSLNTPVLVAAVFDDDVLYYELWVNGNLVDTYNSDPDAYEEDIDPESVPEPVGGDVAKLCVVFSCKDPAAVQSVLHKKGGTYTFESDRHRDFVSAVGFPSASASTGYEYISQGELPDTLTREQLRLTTGCRHDAKRCENLDKLTTLLQYSSAVKDYERQCEYNADLYDPNLAIKQNPNAFGGLSSESKEWGGLISAFEVYKRDACNYASISDQLVDKYRLLWDANLTDAQLSSVVSFLSAPDGHAYMAGMRAVTNGISKELTPLVTSIAMRAEATYRKQVATILRPKAEE